MVTKATGVGQFTAGECGNGERSGPTWNPEKQLYLKGFTEGSARATAGNEEKPGVGSGHGAKGKPF